MSIIPCAACAHWIDTDYEDEFYLPKDLFWQYPLCEDCLIAKEKDEENKDVLMLSKTLIYI